MKSDISHFKGGEKMQLECKIIAPESSGVQIHTLGNFCSSWKHGADVFNLEILE